MLCVAFEFELYFVREKIGGHTLKCTPLLPLLIWQKNIKIRYNNDMAKKQKMIKKNKK